MYPGGSAGNGSVGNRGVRRTIRAPSGLDGAGRLPGDVDLRVFSFSYKASSHESMDSVSQ